MTKYTSKTQVQVEKPMRAFKQGTLTIGRSGMRVKSPKQAGAIGLSEAKKNGENIPNKEEKIYK